MGDRKRKKQEFLRAHPNCCFCGGGNLSQEPDHIPSRALFVNRQWPEGYEFPSCIRCNRASRHDELVVSLISRLYPDPTTEQEEKELNKFADSVNKYVPQVISEIQLGAAKKKRLAREHGYSIPEGGTSNDIPMFSLEGKRTNEAVLSFSRKLIFALYYKHTGNIVPKEGGVAVVWFSNLQVKNGAIPKEVVGCLSQNPRLERNSINLDSQFNYKYLISECDKNAVFLVSLRHSFWILGHLKINRSDFDESVYINVMSPFE